MNSYKEMKSRHEAELHTFPMKFAFSAKQFAECMAEWGLDTSETDKIYAYGDTGGFYRRSDAATLHEMLDRHELERKEAIAADKTGDGYIFDMFYYELGNHEYNFTSDVSDTFEALGLTNGEIAADSRLSHGLKKACKEQQNG